MPHVARCESLGGGRGCKKTAAPDKICPRPLGGLWLAWMLALLPVVCEQDLQVGQVNIAIAVEIAVGVAHPALPII